jgi:uncharacterized protein with PQ loop repeat
MKMLASITINLSFILYLIFYLPQILHNQRRDNIQHLSINMHALLYCGYIADLMYGFAMHYPWQYKTVSLVGSICLSIQHYQILKYHKFSNLPLKLLSFCIIILITGRYYKLVNVIWLGSLAHLCFVSYMLPQIIKNYQNKAHTRSTNKFYLILSMIISILDTISAYLLNWALPNKIAAPVSLSLKLILFKQILEKH